MAVKKDKDRGTFYFVVDLPMAGGRRRQVRRRGFPTVTAAKKAERELLNAADEGQYVARRRDTVAEFLVDTWLPGKADKVRESTFLGYEKAVKTRIVPRIGNVRLQDVDAAMLEAFYSDLAKTGGTGGGKLSPKTVSNVAGVLSVAFGDAVRWRMIPRNPAKDAHLVRRPQVRRTPWTEDEAAAFLDAVSDDRLFPLWRLALATGMRRGELCGLRWGDVDLDAGTVAVTITRVQARTVIVGEPKTKTSCRTIAIDPETARALRSWKRRQAAERIASGGAWQDSGYVFVDELGRPPHPETVSRWWREAIERVGARPIRLHDARHTAASVMLRARVPLKVVSERLGHADVAVTMRVYQHVTTADDREAADALAAAFSRKA